MEKTLEISENLLWELDFLMRAVFLGLFLRAGYDLLIVFRRLVKHGSFWTGFEDFAYCTAGALITFTLFYNVNQGAPRGFAMAGIVLGLALYHFGPSRLVCLVLEKVIRFVTWPVRKTAGLFKKRVKKC